MVFELANVTTAPEGPAWPLRVTVPVTVVADPPTTLVGDTVTLVSVAAVTASVPVRLTVPKVPVIVAEVEASTLVVVAVNVA